MFVACGIWCLADVSSVSPSSEQTGELWANQCLKCIINAFRLGLSCLSCLSSLKPESAQVRVGTP